MFRHILYVNLLYMDKNIVHKILDLETLILRTQHYTNNRTELYDILKTNIIKYLENPKCIYNDNYLSMYKNTNDIENNYMVMKNNFTKNNYELIVIYTIGTINNIMHLQKKIEMLKQIPNIFFCFAIIDELYDDLMKINYFRMFNENVVILKTKNKGCDIGQYYLCIDYIIKNNINYEYILKLHNKSDLTWLEKLTPYLNSKTYFLNTFNKIKTNNMNLYGTNNINLDFRNLLCLEHIMDNYKSNILRELITTYNTTFIAGTIFFISKNLMDFVLDIVPLYCYNSFEEIYSSNHSIYEQSIIHSIERIFSILDTIKKLNY